MTRNWFYSISKIAFWLLYLWLLPALVLAQNNLSQAIPLNPNIRQGTLPNGLTYFIRQNSEPKNYAELRMGVRVGSNAEEDDQQGAAHFIKHAVFRGTKNFSKKEIQNFSKRTGFPTGPDSTASTGFDETYFILPIPLDSVGMLEEGLELLKDRAHNALFDSVEIEKERDILLEETQWDAGPEIRMRTAYFKSLLKNSRYGERLTILNEEHIKKIKPERLRQFYQDWYRPDLMAIAAVGDFDANQVEKLIKQKFGSIPEAEDPRKRIDYPFPLTGGTEVFIVTDSAATECTISVKHFWPDFEVRTRANIHKDLVNRFFDEMIDKRMKGSHMRGGFLGGANEFSPFISTKETDKLEEFLVSILTQIAFVRQFGFTQLELEAVKRDSRETLIGIPYESGMPSGFYAQEYIFYFMNGYPIFDKTFYADFVSGMIDDVTLEEVNRWSERVLNSDRRSIMITGPENQKDELPTEDRVRELLDSAGRETEPPIELQIKKLVENLKGKKPLSKREHEKVGVTEIVLSNGVRVLLKPVDPTGGFVQFIGKAKGGTSSFMNELENARYTQRFLLKHAMGPFDAEELNEYSNKKNVSIGARIGESSRTISGSVSGEPTADLEAALQLVYAYFTIHKIDSSAAKSLIIDDETSLTNTSPNNQTIFEDAFDSVLDGGNPLRRRLTIEDVNKVDLDRSIAIYKTLFSDVSDFVFTITGSFEINKIEPLLEKYLGNLPIDHSVSRPSVSNVVIPKGRIEKVVYNNLDSKSRVRLVLGGGYGLSTEAPIQFNFVQIALQMNIDRALRALGDSSHSVVLWNANERILLPPNYHSLIIDVYCSPKITDEVVEIVKTEIKKIKAEGVISEIIEEFLPYQLSMTEKMELFNFWPDNISQSAFEGTDLNEILESVKPTDEITPASTKAAAQKYLTDDYFIKVVLIPEKR